MSSPKCNSAEQRSKQKERAPDYGRELPNAEAARAEGIDRARALVGEQALQGYIDLTHRIEIEDERGERIATVDFQEAVDVWALKREPLVRNLGR